MSEYTNITELKDSIRHLKVSREVQEKHLKEMFDSFLESLKPKHLLHTTYQTVASSSKLTEIVVGALLVVTGGYFVRKMISKGSTKLIRSIISIATQSAITFAATKYRGNIKSLLKNLGEQISGKSKANTAAYI